MQLYSTRDMSDRSTVLRFVGFVTVVIRDASVTISAARQRGDKVAHQPFTYVLTLSYSIRVDC